MPIIKVKTRNNEVALIYVGSTHVTRVSNEGELVAVANSSNVNGVDVKYAIDNNDIIQNFPFGDFRRVLDLAGNASQQMGANRDAVVTALNAVFNSDSEDLGGSLSSLSSVAVSNLLADQVLAWNYDTSSGTPVGTKKWVNKTQQDTVVSSSDMVNEVFRVVSTDQDGTVTSVSTDVSSLNPFSADQSSSSARNHTLSAEMKVVADQGGSFKISTDNGATPAVITDRVEVDQVTGLKLNGLSWPLADGTAGQVIRTNGSGSLSFVSISALQRLDQDTTPQLGGDLDVNGNKITSASNGDVTIDPDGTGSIILKSDDIQFQTASLGVTGGDLRLYESGFFTPQNFISIKAPGAVTADTTLVLPDGAGSDGQALTTNGTGTLSWSNVLSDTAATLFGVTSLKHVGASDATLAFFDQNASNFVALTVPSDIASNLTFTLPVADGTSGQAMVTDGSGNLSFADAGGSDGWHGSTTRIKLLPRDFVPSDGGRPAMIDDVNIGIDKLFLESHSTLPLYATVAIPTGYKATHVMVHGDNNNTDAVEVWEFQINSATGVSKGTGNVQTEINITDVTSSTTNYLLLSVQNGASKEIHGGYVTIEAV